MIKRITLTVSLMCLAVGSIWLVQLLQQGNPPHFLVMGSRSIDLAPSEQEGFGLVIVAIGVLVSWFICAMLVRYEHLHSFFSHDHTDGGPQKFHTKPTPRIGGVAIFIALLAVGFLARYYEVGFSLKQFWLLLVASLPAFFGGLAEDITKKVGVLPRLVLTMASGGMGIYLLGATLHRLDMVGIDTLLMVTPFAMMFTVFAIGGVANAINIIDGFNGLASGYGVIVLAAMAWVAHSVGDNFVMTSSLAMIGALIGFLAWNFPFGKIFMGDGGAYLLGFLLAELSVLLVQRNPQVSPWFPLALLIYPVFETVFTIYRRKFKENTKFGEPDAKHLHTLIYRAIFQKLGREGNFSHFSNSLTSATVWLGFPLVAVMAVIFSKQTSLLMVLSLVFCGCYLMVYRKFSA